MPTVRTPLKRRTRRRITPEAVEAFKAGDGLALYRALGLQPWMAFPHGAEDICPWPAGTMGALFWAEMMELRADLEKAAGWNWRHRCRLAQ